MRDSGAEELPFVSTPVGPIDAAYDLAAQAADAWGLPEPELLRAGMNASFACGDDVVLRVGRVNGDPAASHWLAAHLRRHGIRGPRPMAVQPLTRDGLTVVAQQREHPVGEIEWEEVGAMVAQVHRLDPGPVALHHPLPRGASFPWWDLERLLAEVDDLLDPSSRAALREVVSRHGDWHRRGIDEVVCHGDVHPGNVIQTAVGAVLLDWDLLCRAPAAWDHAPLLTWSQRWGGEPGIYERFASGYGHCFADDEIGRALAELRLVAATVMRLRAGRVDPQAAEEAERRLRWWRGETDAPTWVAQ